jgi:hypothetical protein
MKRTMGWTGWACSKQIPLPGVFDRNKRQKTIPCPHNCGTQYGLRMHVRDVHGVRVKL